MNIAVYNNTGKQVSTREVSDAIFAVPSKSALVHQVYHGILANAREAWAHTKDRSDVRGGGRKPWKQKGTGRARHGSNRSPIWSGGGVTFGPLNVRNYTQKINKKMKRLAVRMCLSSKVSNEQFLLLDALSLSGKTKEMATLRAALPGQGKTTLLLVDECTEAVKRATANIPKLDVKKADDVNVVDLLHHQYVIANPESIDVLEKRLAL